MFNLFILEVIGSLFFFLVVFLIIYVIFWQFYFLRDPARKIPPGKVIVSPADGKVINIMECDFSSSLRIRKGFLGSIETLSGDVGQKVTVISIFMSPLDVHVNRAPYEGEVLSVKPVCGKFFNAGDIEKSLMNEKNEILIKAPFGRMKVIQIAGFLARRIESFVSKGQKLVKGQRVGLINLGSQVTLILPTEKIRLKVRLGSRVKAGSSILAEVS